MRKKLLGFAIAFGILASSCATIAKNVGVATCEQQCFNNSLTAAEQFECKRQCNNNGRAVFP